MIRKFLSALLILMLAVFLQFSLVSFFGFYSDLTLAALIALSLSVGLPELIILTLAAVFMLNSRPAPSWDMLVFGLLPIISFCAARAVKWKPWTVNLAATFSAFLAMYLIFAPNFLLTDTISFLSDLIVGLAFGAAAFYVFGSINE